MSGQDGTAAAGSAHAQAQHGLPQGWEASYDQHHSAWYYFNRSTGETSWTPPTVETNAHHDTDSKAGAGAQPSAAATDAAAVTTAAGSAAGPESAPANPGVAAIATGAAAGAAPSAAAASPAPSSLRSGWYYRDRSGVLHGPFGQDHLHAWRNYLPMDLLVWYVELGLGALREGNGASNKRQRGQPQPSAQGTEATGGEAPAGAATEGNQEDLAAQKPAATKEAGTLPGLGTYEDEADEEQDFEAEPAAAGSNRQDAGRQQPAKKARGESPEGAVRESNGDGTEPNSEVGGLHGGDGAVAVGGVTQGAEEDGADGEQSEEPEVEPANAEEAIACGLPGIELAELLGDGALLADWRQRFPGASRARHGVAPPAPVHDHWLRSAAAAAAAAHAHAAAAAHYHAAYHGQGAYPAYGVGYGTAADAGPRPPPSSREESMAEYAAAVLAGLPPDDEAVVLARQAAAAGRSLVDVVAFATSQAASAAAAGYEPPPVEGEEVKPPPVSEHGTATEYVRDPRSGRLAAVPADAAPPSSAKALYGEFGNWMNPEQIEDYLAQAKKWRREKMPAIWAKKKLKEIRELKERKKKRQELLKWGPDL
ncbi:hypothetical protein HYH02_005115 [Chlamydomonas schloesseri]|uniref:WW domain-containing protein n=1 Tax=Chlamydomonas schloesseri TaxID=2026947 RepID=A0A835WLH9_9CHLO|nr:hypothetical protein HYH02_005115 [Chlamydomonas schloesseri]|eukprot:KAG2449582.1 hypothetical protein HYH02_005115 [Chlamydomonas schloesseri]